MVVSNKAKPPSGKPGSNKHVNLGLARDVVYTPKEGARQPSSSVAGLAA
jgi:hypothetical protein